MNTITEPAPAKRRRGAPVLWVSGALAAAVLVLGISGTLSGWTSAIMTNGNNYAGTTGAVALEESGFGADGTTTVTCTTAASADNTATCDQINKYGDGGKADTTLAPNQSITSTITLTNTAAGDGTSLTMAPGACSSTYNTGVNAGDAVTVTADDLCGELQVAVACTGGAVLNVGPVSLATFTGSHAFGSGLASGASTTCTFTVSLPDNAPSRFSGQTATQPIVWTLSGV